MTVQLRILLNLCLVSVDFSVFQFEVSSVFTNTVNDRHSGDRFSGNDGLSGTKNPDDAILFTVSGITVLVELFFGKFGHFLSIFLHFYAKSNDL